MTGHVLLSLSSSCFVKPPPPALPAEYLQIPILTSRPADTVGTRPVTATHGPGPVGSVAAEVTVVRAVAHRGRQINKSIFSGVPVPMLGTLKEVVDYDGRRFSDSLPRQVGVEAARRSGLGGGSGPSDKLQVAVPVTR